MRLVFPFCEKEKQIAIRVLKWASMLNERIDAPALLCYDDSTDAKEVLEIANDLFTKLDTFVYPTPKALGWPRVPNRVFQACARHIATLPKMPWFWWEPDLTPLKPDWFKTIAEAHTKGGRPFSGHIVRHVIPSGHMTGCGVYPPDFALRYERAMFADAAAWDVNMGKDVVRKCTPLNHLLQHQYFGEDGESCPTFPTLTSLNILAESAVTFHRCKDGTLMDRLVEDRGSPTPVQRMVAAVQEWVSGVSPRYGVIAYVPPPGVGHSDVFLKHIEEYPPKNRLFILSDHEWPRSFRIPDPTKNWKNSDRIASTVFLHALRFAQRKGLTHFVYLETDCRVKGDDWDVKLFDEFVSGKKLIAGGNMGVCSVQNGDRQFKQQFESLAKKHGCNDTRHKVHKTAILTHKFPNPVPIPFVNGAVGIYSVAQLEKLFPEETPEQAVENGFTVQDRSIAERALTVFSPTETLSRFKHIPQIMATAGEQIYPFTTRINTLNRGNVTCVHPIKNRWRPPPPGGYSFYHSGDFGDIIYALKAIQLIGGGKLVCGHEYNGDHPPRAPITRAGFELLAPLLKLQPYLAGFEFSDKEVPCSHDLNQFREFWQQRHTKYKLAYETLIEMNCYTIGVEPLFTQSPWLTAEKKTIAPFIIHRSARYNALDFPWQAIVDRFGPSACFVGLPEEHKAFSKAFGHISFYQPRDFAELAAVINGAKWFIGNQSFPCSIALGLGQNVMQEAYYVKRDGTEASPDCLFNRRDNFFTQKDELEDIPWT